MDDVSCQSLGDAKMALKKGTFRLSLARSLGLRAGPPSPLPAAHGGGAAVAASRAAAASLLFLLVPVLVLVLVLVLRTWTHTVCESDVL